VAFDEHYVKETEAVSTALLANGGQLRTAFKRSGILLTAGGREVWGLMSRIKF